MSIAALAQKLIAIQLVSGDMVAGSEIALRIDRTLTQDATGALVMLELEALGLDRVRTEVSVQYVDHKLLHLDSKIAENRAFLESACRCSASPAQCTGNGSAALTQRWRTQTGPRAAVGSLGMLAIGVGGLEVDLSSLESLIASPSSPGNVTRTGREVAQVVVGRIGPAPSCR